MTVLPLVAIVHIHHSMNDSGIGFNVGWAVAGDLIDNGSMDPSGGFVAGGLLGGLLD